MATTSLLEKWSKMTPEQLEEQDRRFAKLEAEEAARQTGNRLAALMLQLGNRYSPKLCSLDTFEVYCEAQRTAVNRLRSIQSRLSAFIGDGSGLVLFGAVGTGKDHLLAAMLYAAADLGLACKWVNGQEVYGRFRDAIEEGKVEREIIADLAAPDVLGISDPVPPSGNPSPYNLQQLYRLLDRRYRELKPTWITLNALSPEDADAKLSAQCFDRLRDGAEILRCFWPSYRERRTARK